jgi:O-acetyl-ADP-ribose deacetylase (regulator of RNase III)
MVKYVKGDLFETDRDIIAHGCNCRGGYGSGVAYTMAKTYPRAKLLYLEKYDEDGWDLGDVQMVLQRDNKYVANCATQDQFMPRGVCHADYSSIRICMEKVKKFAKDKGLSVAMPKIGAGLAGGDWNLIEKILEEVFVDYEVTVYYL